MADRRAGETERLRALLAEREAEAARAREEAEALKARLRVARRSGRAKTHFIGNVSHEFRTPLSSIIGFSALLAQDGDELPSAVRREYLEIVNRNARHLLHVANDVLNISKVEAGTLEVTPARLDPAEVTRAAIASLTPQARNRGVEVVFVAHTEREVVADSGRLRQVLYNLLENAVKYSPQGGRIDVRLDESGDDVRIEVTDRGPGIEDAARPRLFKAFSRANPPGSRVVGAGLGLALSRMLAEAMGGRIGVESTPGEGSTFWVTLLAAPPAGAALQPPAAAPAAAAAVSAGGRGETVAVVDDDADIRAFAEAALRRAGFNPVSDDGSAGVGERLAAFEPAAVLLDLNLGGRTGGDALAELRARAETRDVPVVAFTAGGPGAADVPCDGTAPRGFVARLAKPATPDALVACVADVLAKSQPGAGAAPGDGAGEEDEEEEDFLQPLRARFRAGLRDRRREMARAVEEGDGEALRRAVHKLRGAAAGYGFAELAEEASTADDLLRADAAAAGRAVQRLIDALAREAER